MNDPTASKLGAQNSCLRHRAPMVEGGPRAHIVLNTMIALCDFTEAIGATRFVPDSNKLPYPKPDGEDAWYQRTYTVPRFCPPIPSPIVSTNFLAKS